MKWTTEKPTKPGWYWVCKAPSAEPTMGSVYRMANSRTWRVEIDGLDAGSVSRYAHWAGPIEPPEDE